MAARTIVIFLLLNVLAVAGCAEGARTERMLPATQAQPGIAASPLHRGIALTEVVGGRETNPLLMANVGNAEFDAALREALARADLLAPDAAAAPFRLRVALVDVTEPRSGFTTSVNAAVRYMMTRTDGAEVLDELITAHFMLSAAQVFYGVERLRVVKEGAMRENIALFLQRLSSLNLAPPSSPRGRRTR